MGIREWAFLVAAGGLWGQGLEGYGTLNLTLTRDSGLMPEGARPPGQKGDELYDLSARTSQVGLRLQPALLQGLRFTGRLEGDFQGGTAASPQLRLRHAYLAFGAPDGAWELLAGRTDEVIAPLRADSINFPAENWPGDLGTRRNLLRGTWRRPAGGHVWRAALALTAFSQGLEDPAKGGVLETEQVPAAEGRLSLELKGGSAVHLWGHYGRKHHLAHDLLPEGTLKTHSLGTSLQWVAGAWSFSLEAWQGRVEDGYPRQPELLGLAWGDAVRTVGGWTSVGYKPDPAWRFNLGLGLHDPENRGLQPGKRDRMASWFANAYWTLKERFEVGLEASRWQSTFQGTTASNDELRVQLSLSYSF